MDNVRAANKAFFEAVKAGNVDLNKQRARWYQANMERDAKTGAWTATIPLKDGFSQIDFFSNHGREVNGYKQYISSPYTQVKR